MHYQRYRRRLHLRTTDSASRFRGQVHQVMHGYRVSHHRYEANRKHLLRAQSDFLLELCGGRAAGAAHVFAVLCVE